MDAGDYIAVAALLISIPGAALAVFDHFRGKRDRIAQLEREYVSMIEGMTRDIHLLERSVLAHSGRMRRLAAKAKYKKQNEIENSLLAIIDGVLEPQSQGILNMRRRLDSFPRRASPDLLNSLVLVHELRENIQTMFSGYLTDELRIEQDAALAEQALDFER